MVLCFAAPLWADTLPERPKDYVVDLAGIIDTRTADTLNGYLQELERKTTAQVIVLTVKSLEGVPIENLSLQTVQKWKLGQQGKDNGLLILIALTDRKYRVEVGYGLEGALPDGKVGSLGREFLVPDFKKGEYASAIAKLTIAISGIIAEESGVQIEGMPRLRPASRQARKKGSAGSTVMALVMLAIGIFLFIRYPRLMILLLLTSGGRGGGWGGGGGFGGGGGSFGGGGGGGFGGGGSSGSW